MLLTVLLVLAIVASTALVFTNRVELLKLAVVLSLWAAVMGAFVSVLYRRQSETDAAKARDMKYVYDLQLDREISARREYELSVESHLRREIGHELRTAAAEEVAALRAEVNALRSTLEYLFDTDLSHRPELPHEQRAALGGERRFADDSGGFTAPDRVQSSRITAGPEESPDDDADDEPHTAETPIIDVPEEPLEPVEAPRTPEPAEPRPGSHRRRDDESWIPPQFRNPEPPPPVLKPPPPMPPPPVMTRPPEMEPTPAMRPTPPPATAARHAPPPQQPSPQQSAPQPQPPQHLPQPPQQQWPEPEPRGRHERHARHAGQPGQPGPQHPQQQPPARRSRRAPEPAAQQPPLPQPPQQQPPQPQQPQPEQAPEDARPGRHRGSEERAAETAAELLVRLNRAPSGGGGRRRRDD
ncbi:hypothetical protein MBRU_14665 [Mycolicibacterium brumae DSM 44177]|nr:hypothetical protein MBRU_14665 [Mycolicibacterium brumae DSM 44177]